MRKVKAGWVATAALCMAASPAAMAQGRSAQALPAVSAPAFPASVNRASQPVVDANELRRRLSPAWILGLLALLAAILATAGGGGSDSPG